MYTILLLIFLFVCIAYIVYAKKDILNPVYLYCLVFLTGFLVASLRLSGLLSDYPFWFYALIIILVTVFCLSAKLGIRTKLKNKKKFNNRNYSKKSINIISFALWVIIVSSFAVMIIKLGPPPAISLTVRSDYFISGFGTIVLQYVVLYSLVIYDRYNLKYINKTISYIYILTSIIIAVLLANKYQTFYLIMIYFIARNTFGRKIKIKTFAIISVIAVLVFAFYQYFVYEAMYGVSNELMTEVYKMKLPENLGFITQPYIYVAINYENLYHFIKNQHHWLWGWKSLGWIVEMMGFSWIWPSKILANTSEWTALLQYKLLNTGTMYSDFARDFGLPGMFIASLLCGFISGYSYKKFKMSPKYFNFYLYITTTWAILLSFFSNIFTMKSTIVSVAVAYIVNVFLYNCRYD